MYKKSQLVKTGIPFSFWLAKVRWQEKTETITISDYLELVDLAPSEFDLLDEKGVYKHFKSYFKKHPLRKMEHKEQTRLAEIKKAIVQAKRWSISMAQEGKKIDALATIQSIDQTQTIRLNGDTLTPSDILSLLMIYSEVQFATLSAKELEFTLNTFNGSLDYYPRICHLLEVVIFLKEDHQQLEEVSI